VALIEALACPWDRSRYEDEFQKRLKRILRRKAKGHAVKAPPAREKEPPLLANVQDQAHPGGVMMLRRVW
jgi:non-homologous end joining protein Ku